MKNTIFTGAGVAIITPMLEDGSVDYAGLAKNIDFQIENDTDAIIICGTTGESSTLDDKEHRECIRFAVEHTHNRIPVIAGTGSNDTKYAIELSQEAQELGANGLLIVTPYYNKTTQRGLVAHYNAIADSVDLPIILYNVPSRTGVNIAPQTIVDLCRDVPNIVGVKEASGNFSLLAHTRYLCPDDFYVWSGNDDQVVPMMALGAKGVISVVSNIAPEVMVKMSHLCLDNDIEAASKLQIQYMDLIDALFCEVNPIPVKTAMNLMGMEAGPLRLPLCDMSEKNLAILRGSMERMGLLK